MLRDKFAGLVFLDEVFAGDNCLTVVSFLRTPEASTATLAVAHTTAHLKKEGCGLEDPATFGPVRGSS